MNDSFRFYKDSTILSVRPLKFPVNFFWAKHVVLHNIHFELSLVVHVKMMLHHLMSILQSFMGQMMS